MPPNIQRLCQLCMDNCTDISKADSYTLPFLVHFPLELHHENVHSLDPKYQVIRIFCKIGWSFQYEWGSGEPENYFCWAYFFSGFGVTADADSRKIPPTGVFSYSGMLQSCIETYNHPWYLIILIYCDWCQDRSTLNNMPF